MNCNEDISKAFFTNNIKVDNETRCTVHRIGDVCKWQVKQKRAANQRNSAQMCGYTL